MSNQAVIKNKKKKIFSVDKLIAHILLIFSCLLVVAPFSIVVSTSFKTLADSVKIPFKFMTGYINLYEYTQILGVDSELWDGLKNTLIVVVPIMFIGTLTSSLAAFSFAKIKFRLSNPMFMVLMMSMMMPGVITMTPAYVLYDMVGWTDTYWPLMLPNAFGTAACVFYMRQFFNGIPNDLIEAAELDGLNRFGVFVYIMLPLAKPALTAQIILWLIAGYNDYFGPLIYLNTSEKFTLQLVLNLMTGSSDNNWPKIMAACVCIMIPLLVIYFVAQKQFIKGIVMSGMKD